MAEFEGTVPLMQSSWHMKEIAPISSLQNPRPYTLLAVVNLAGMVHYNIARVTQFIPIQPLQVLNK